MRVVTLVSGGLDSTVMAVMIRDQNIEQRPLFVNYRQRAFNAEWDACKNVFSKMSLPNPTLMDLSGFGHLILSGLTTPDLDVREHAFLPGRNLLFLLAASAYAWQEDCSAVAIGLLNEETHLFPDQTQQFLTKSQEAISEALFLKLKVIAPLMHLSKADVIGIARNRSICGTYSCHAGTNPPCGICVSCLEITDSRKEV